VSKPKVGDTDIELEAGPTGVELTMDGQKVRFDQAAFDNTMEKVDGGMRITRPDGVALVMWNDGNVTIENLTPTSLGIKNLAEVKSYSIQTVNQVNVHRVEFAGGGYIEVSYAQSGAVLGLSGHNIFQSINADREILIGQGKSATGAAH
jgi:hypothetical protein